jgi:hypothetical protein
VGLLLTVDFQNASTFGFISSLHLGQFLELVKVLGIHVFFIGSFGIWIQKSRIVRAIQQVQVNLILGHAHADNHVQLISVWRVTGTRQNHAGIINNALKLKKTKNKTISNITLKYLCCSKRPISLTTSHVLRQIRK